MSLRCGCSSDGDPIVFGECRTCRPEPEVPAPASALRRAAEAVTRAASMTRGDFTLYPPERPWERVLGPDEVEA